MTADRDTKPGKLMLFCSLHGASGARAKCSLAASLRRAWREQWAKRRDDSLILTAVENADPNHGAVCAKERSQLLAILDGCEHEKMVRDCLKSAIRSAKAARTRAAKRKSA